MNSSLLNWGRIAVGLLVSIAVLVLFSLNALFVVLSLLATYWLIRPYCSAQITTSKFYLTIIATFAYVTILQIAVLCVWVVNHNFPLNNVIIVTGIIILVCFLAQLKFTRHQTDNRHSRILDRFDIYALLIATMVTCLILAGPIKNSLAENGSISIAAVSVNYLNTSLDDSSHFGRVNDRLQLNRGVLYGTNVTDHVVNQLSVTYYPAGWHSANAAVIKAFDPNIKVGGQSLLAYVATKIFWMFILVYLFCRVTFSAFRLFYKRLGRRVFLAELIWLAGSLSYFSYYMLVEQFKEGFYNFIPLLISQLLILLFLLQLSDDTEASTKPKNLTSNYRALAPAALFMTSAVLTWFLLLPAVAVFFAAFIFYASRNTDIKLLLKQMWLQLRPQALLAFLAIVSVVAQYKIMTADGARSFRQSVNEPGAITLHSHWYFGFAVLGVFLLLALSGKMIRNLRHVSPYIVSLLGIALFIYIFQLVTINKYEYFYIKSLNTVMIMAIPLCLIGWLGFLKLLSRDEKANGVFLSIGLVFLLPLIIGIESLNSPNINYLKGERDFSNNENRSIYRNISERGKIAVKNRSTDTIMYIPNKVGHNIIGTNITRSIQRADTCDSKIFGDLLTNSEANLFKDINACQKTSLTIITREESFNHVQNLVNSYNLNKKVTVRQVN